MESDNNIPLEYFCIRRESIPNDDVRTNNSSHEKKIASNNISETNSVFKKSAPDGDESNKLESNSDLIRKQNEIFEKHNKRKRRQQEKTYWPSMSEYTSGLSNTTFAGINYKSTNNLYQFDNLQSKQESNTAIHSELPEQPSTTIESKQPNKHLTNTNFNRYPIYPVPLEPLDHAVKASAPSVNILNRSLSSSSVLSAEPLNRAQVIGSETIRQREQHTIFLKNIYAEIQSKSSNSKKLANFVRMNGKRANLNDTFPQALSARHGTGVVAGTGSDSQYNSNFNITPSLPLTYSQLCDDLVMRQDPYNFFVDPPKVEPQIPHVHPPYHPNKTWLMNYNQKSYSAHRQTPYALSRTDIQQASTSSSKETNSKH